MNCFGLLLALMLCFDKHTHRDTHTHKCCLIKAMFGSPSPTISFSTDLSFSKKRIFRQFIKLRKSNFDSLCFCYFRSIKCSYQIFIQSITTQRVLIGIERSKKYLQARQKTSQIKNLGLRKTSQITDPI